MTEKNILDQLLEEKEKPLTLKQAAKFLNLKPVTLYRKTHKKLIPFSKPGGKVIYFQKADLIKWMKGNKVSGQNIIDGIETTALRCSNCKKNHLFWNEGYKVSFCPDCGTKITWK